MAQSATIAALAAALCETQFEMEGAKKDNVNPHFKSRYADLASVWNAAKAALHKHGLAIVQAPEPYETGIQLRTVLLHKSGEWIDSTIAIPAQQQSAQGFGSAMSYARRYALAAMIGIVADEDDDGNAASQPARNGGSSYEPRQAPQQQRPAQQAAPADAPVCEVHGTPMRVGKNGGHFCATKLADGTWCKARSAKPAPATSDEWDEIDAAAANRFRN